MAFATITRDAAVLRYGIELDAHRAEQARGVAHEVIYGSAFDVHCPVGSFGLLYLNPPCGFECGEDQTRRTERTFLGQFCRWLKPSGVLVFVVPGRRLGTCDRLLALQFKEKRVYQLSAPDAAKYGQVVLFGTRRSRRERDRLRDSDVIAACNLIGEMSRNWKELPVLPDQPDVIYSIPEGGPVKLVYNLSYAHRRGARDKVVEETIWGPRKHGIKERVCRVSTLRTQPQGGHPNGEQRKRA